MLVEPITAAAGARISEIDLSKPVTAEQAAEIKAALKRYKVLTFPDQSVLAPETFSALGAHFGDVLTKKHPSHEHFPDSPGVKILKTSGQGFGGRVDDSWHTDGSASYETRWISLLQAVDVPPVGRDTLFADMEAAYDQLSPSLQTLFEGLTAIHSWGDQAPGEPEFEHPIVFQDPDTGRKSLYADRGYTRHILGLRASESRALLELLFQQAQIPECQVRISWKPGSLAMWDNRRTQHYLVQDLQYPRVMHRVMAYPRET